jgi:hypothetical protein
MSTTNELSVVLSVVLRRVRLPVIRTYNRPVAGSTFGPKVTSGQPKHTFVVCNEEKNVSTRCGETSGSGIAKSI